MGATTSSSSPSPSATMQESSPTEPLLTPRPVVQPSHSVMRTALATLVTISVLAYIALIIWGIKVTEEKENQSETKGLATLSDMLAQSKSITAFYVIVVSLWGELRVMWGVAHLLDSTHAAVMAPLDLAIGKWFTMKFINWFAFLTGTIAALGALQVMFLLLLAVLPVKPPGTSAARTHQAVAGMVAFVSVLRALFLILRRDAVYGKYVRAQKQASMFGGERWKWVRMLSILNLVTMIVSGITFTTLTNAYPDQPDAAIAEYFMFFSFIADCAFQLFDAPAVIDETL